jgi:hypothetical protein
VRKSAKSKVGNLEKLDRFIIIIFIKNIFINDFMG